MTFRYNAEKTQQANNKIREGGIQLTAALEKIMAGIQEHKEGMDSPGIGEARADFLNALLDRKPVIDEVGRIASGFVLASEQAGRAFGPAEETLKDVWNETPDAWRDRELPELPVDAPPIPDTFTLPDAPGEQPPQQ